MTHEELLRSLNYEIGLGETYGTATDLSSTYALRAVVELHRPVIHALPVETCLACQNLYPCKTIQAIEKHLGRD